MAEVDPLEQLRSVRDEMSDLEARHLEQRRALRRRCAALIRELLDQGYSLADVGDELGLSRQRVHALSRE